MAGCRPDDRLDCAPASRPVSVADFAGHYSAPTQTFALDLGQRQTIRGSGGATLDFPAHSFELANGSLATGTAQVRLREIYAVPGMVLADIPTTTGASGQLLVSGGEFQIQVWQNATRLRFRPGPTTPTVALQSPVPAGQDTTGQQLWQRRIVSASVDSSGWYPAAPAGVQAASGTYRAALALDSVSWWSIGRPWLPGQPTVQVEVNTPASGDTRVYLRPVGYNALVRLTAVSGAAGARWQASVPPGADLLAVVLQAVNGQLFYGTQRVTTAPNLVITPPLAAVTEAEAARRIGQL